MNECVSFRCHFADHTQKPHLRGALKLVCLFSRQKVESWNGENRTLSAEYITTLSFTQMQAPFCIFMSIKVIVWGFVLCRLLRTGTTLALDENPQCSVCNKHEQQLKKSIPDNLVKKRKERIQEIKSYLEKSDTYSWVSDYVLFYCEVAGILGFIGFFLIIFIRFFLMYAKCDRLKHKYQNILGIQAVLRDMVIGILLMVWSVLLFLSIF